MPRPDLCCLMAAPSPLFRFRSARKVKQSRKEPFPFHYLIRLFFPQVLDNLLVRETIGDRIQMWPFKKTKLARPDEFPAVVDAVKDKLRSHGFTTEADHLERILEGVWTTSNELYGELFVALKGIQRERRDLPRDIAAEIRRLMKSINSICPWR